MSLSFVTKPTEEEKKIRKLKYNVFVNGKINEETKQGSWAFLVIDINENKTILDAVEENTNNLRIELIGIIECLKWISNHTEQKYKKYVQITLNTSSVYCYNLINEWIDTWAKDQTISTRPNSDLLQNIYKYKKVMNIYPKMTYKVSNEHTWSVYRKTSEKLNLDI